MRGVRRFSFAALVAIFATVLAGCTGGSSRLAGTPTIPTRDAFRYRPLVPTSPRPAPRQQPRNTQQRRVEVAMPPAEAGWLPAVGERPWQWIVVHHSASDRGSAAIFDDWHRNSRHWDELGYHFVIGNGTNSGDGLVEIGSRWPKQKHGAHCKVWNREEYNQVGVGICLVGNFDKTRPSRAQMDALVRLVDWLSARYRIDDAHIIGHGHVCDTRCPGRYFSFGELFGQLHARRGARAASAKAASR